MNSFSCAFVVGVRNILVRVTNSSPEWCSPMSHFTLWKVIWATNNWEENREHVLYSIMIVNVIGMTQTCSSGQNDRTLLNIFEGGNTTLEWYWRLFWIMFFFFGDAIKPYFLFMEDNARSHRNFQISNIPESEDINCMQRLTYSPDLNSIAHASDALGRRLYQRTHPSWSV